MPIRRDLRFFYPIDWPQLSAVIRFQRARGRCEVCARPHGRTVFHLGDGRWWDTEAVSWRDGRGRVACTAVGTDDVLRLIRTTRVVLAAAHRDHDTANNAGRNLAAFCQRCHMIHDRPEWPAPQVVIWPPEPSGSAPVAQSTIVTRPTMH